MQSHVYATGRDLHMHISDGDLAALHSGTKAWFAFRIDTAEIADSIVHHQIIPRLACDSYKAVSMSWIMMYRRYNHKGLPTYSSRNTGPTPPDFLDVANAVRSATATAGCYPPAWLVVKYYTRGLDPDDGFTVSGI